MPASPGLAVSDRPMSRLAAIRADVADLFGDDARLFAFGRRAAWILVPLVVGLAVILYGTGPEPRRNWYGDMLGNDFSQIWVAGRAALEGRGGEPYDLPVHLENLKVAFGPTARFAWHYPPVFLLPAAAVAMLEPQAAYLLWTTLSLGLFALAMRLAAGRTDAACIALAHPLVFSNLAYGQNGLFTGALMTLGATLVDRRPWLAGLCFGMLAYKPQFAALAPLLLLITGRWACLTACLATVLGLCLASFALFGADPWIGFFGTLSETNRIILVRAAAGLDLNASAFGAVRLLGGPLAMAWIAQGAAALVAIACAWRAWTMPASAELRAAVFLCATPLLSPYVPVYDLIPLVPATVFLVLAARRDGGLRAWEKVLLAVTPFAMLLRPAVAVTGLSFGLALALATFGCVILRIAGRRGGPSAATADRTRGVAWTDAASGLPASTGH